MLYFASVVACKQLISLGVLSLHLFPLGCVIPLGKNGKFSTQLIELCDGLLIIMIYVAYYYINVNEFHKVFHIWLFL